MKAKIIYPIKEIKWIEIIGPSFEISKCAARSLTEWHSAIKLLYGEDYVSELETSPSFIQRFSYRNDVDINVVGRHIEYLSSVQPFYRTTGWTISELSWSTSSEISTTSATSSDDRREETRRVQRRWFDRSQSRGAQFQDNRDNNRRNGNWSY